MRCSACGQESPPAFRFCGSCGARLPASGSTVASKEAEKRQLTVLFCDIIGSTLLSAQLEPEDYREVLRAYQETCASIVHHYGGRIASCVGDGLMIYFGYPLAHENDAERAALAGLDIVEAIKGLAPAVRTNQPPPLKVRVGIHTGVAVVGEMGHGDTWDPMASVGETPNIAARIQEQAEAHTVLVSAATERLLRREVTTRSVGAYELRGLAEPLELFAVVGGRSERAMRPSTTFVGRDEELHWLRERWARAVGSTGEVALVTGDAGIGKSRLVNVFCERITEPHHLWECACSPYDQQSAFRPIIGCLERAIGLRRHDSPHANLARLKYAIATCGVVEELLPALATLLSLPGLEHPMPHGMSPARQQRAVSDAIVALMRGFARQLPLLLVVEDLQWADSSTADFLARYMEETPVRAAFAILTYRPDYAPASRTRPEVGQLRLSKLAAEPAAAMVIAVAAERPLPDAVVAEVVNRADGVPLFLEELTRMMLQSEAIGVRGNLVLTPPRPAFVIPTTLRDLLTAKLDRLGDAKPLAQLAAVIGHEFTYRLLHAVSPLGEPLLRDYLRRLLEADLLEEDPSGAEATYRFKHHLLQEAAYASLLRSKSEEYHERIANVLETQFPETVRDRPEIIAQHYTAGSMPERAVGYWREAGELALKRSAAIEAVAHLRHGLQLIPALPEAPERAAQEVLLQLPLGAALTATKGYAADEVAQAYSRAHELCRVLGEGPQLFPILRGLQSFHMVRGPLGTAHQLGSQLLQLAEANADPVHLVQAHRRLGWCLFCLGSMRAGREHLQRAIELCDRSRRNEHLVTYGADPYTQGLANLAWLDWCTGYAERAAQRANTAIKLARELEHPLSLVYALCVSVPVHQGRGEPELALSLAEESGRIAAHHGFVYWEAWAAILRGWAMVRLGERAAGLVMLRQGLEMYRATGAELFLPYSLALLAEVYRDTGSIDEGLKALDRAHGDAARIEVRFYDAEIHALQGELLAQQGGVTPEDIERCFHRAIAVAREQGALSMELRAALRLARLLQREGRQEEARRPLRDICGRFTEDWRSPELVEAASILESRGKSAAQP
jgi:class 3 adenylate cyclase/predicted ATPase